MPRIAITTANARELAAKSHEARRRRKQAALLAQATAQQPSQPLSAIATDPIGEVFSRAVVDTLNKFLAADDYREKASLARSMREVRETFHMWTGTPKPGVRKPERVSTRQQPGQQSSGPELPPDTTSNSGSTGQ